MITHFCVLHSILSSFRFQDKKKCRQGLIRLQCIQRHFQEEK